MTWSRALDKKATALAFAIGLIAILGALGSQILGGLVPCELCLEQRMAYYWGLPILAAILVLWNRIPLTVWYVVDGDRRRDLCLGHLHGRLPRRRRMGLLARPHRLHRRHRHRDELRRPRATSTTRPRSSPATSCSSGSSAFRSPATTRWCPQPSSSCCSLPSGGSGSRSEGGLASETRDNSAGGSVSIATTSSARRRSRSEVVPPQAKLGFPKVHEPTASLNISSRDEYRPDTSKSVTRARLFLSSP